MSSVIAWIVERPAIRKALGVLFIAMLIAGCGCYVMHLRSTVEDLRGQVTTAEAERDKAQATLAEKERQHAAVMAAIDAERRAAADRSAAVDQAKKAISKSKTDVPIADTDPLGIAREHLRRIR